MNKQRRKAIETKSMDFTIIGTQLYKRGKDRLLRLRANKKEYFPILAQAHVGIASGHFFANITAKSILILGIWWPTLFQDTMAYVKVCVSVKDSKSQSRQKTCHFIL